eukprot:12380757-Alexandrium_andersonii.AAC.1
MAATAGRSDALCGGARSPTVDHQSAFSQSGGHSKQFQALFGNIKRWNAPKGGGQYRTAPETASGRLPEAGS